MLLSAALLSVVASAATAERRLGVMGTSLQVEVEAESRARALEASEAAIRAIEDAERRLSTWREDSEFSKLNRAPAGESFALSPKTAVDLSTALACAELTGGAFDPTVGALVQAWDLRGEGRIPDAAALRTALRRTGHGRLTLLATRAVRRGDVLIEEGGFGKGAALDWAADALVRSGAKSALIDLGGQMLVFGREAQIPIAHPARRDTPVVQLRLSKGSVSTTGNSERARVVDGRRIGHVLDPRTGRPAAERGSVTVVARSAALADCLSTALYVMGPEAALAWAAQRPDVQVAIFDEENGALRVRATSGLKDTLSAIQSSGAAVKLEFEGEVR